MKRLFLLAMVSLTMAVAWAQTTPANTDPYYARRATLFDLLPVSHDDIIMLGNSLTDGAEWN
ncbi:MAG: sialate O-acetylesterase, partial [Muribaculaceae bacterium]|nr:sialate O-acetylesterase [Muribaculaceae bacterium]